jgi:hypothetical protein
VSASQAYSGRSINIYDVRAERWEQFWVDNQGDRTHFVGGPTADGMQLVDERDFSEDAEGPVATRMTFTANSDGSVRQHGEVSADGGTSWEMRYDLTYRRAE